MFGDYEKRVGNPLKQAVPLRRHGVSPLAQSFETEYTGVDPEWWKHSFPAILQDVAAASPGRFKSAPGNPEAVARMGWNGDSLDQS
jgi:hypothetical protein